MAEARVSRPKRRHLVISEFIEACVEENTLLDEDGEWRNCCGVDRLTRFLEFMP
jgi:hypothetical protein